MSDRIEAEILDVLGEEVAAAVDTPLVVIEGPKGDPGAPGKDGAPGIYYGTTQPTGDTHPVWIDPDGGPDDGGLLPAVTAADNGKVLRVINSAWSAEEMPDKLPNPNALTFTGAVEGSYDGSAPLSVEIPSVGGSGSDISLGLTGAASGQIAKITAVDASGVPTAWSPVDMPSGGETWEIIDTIMLLTDVASYILTKVAGWRKIKLTIEKTYKNSGSGSCWLGVYTGNAVNARCLFDQSAIKAANADAVVDVLGFYQLTLSYGNNMQTTRALSQSHKIEYTADITATSVLRLDVDATYAAEFDGTGKILVEGVRA